MFVIHLRDSSARRKTELFQNHELNHSQCAVKAMILNAQVYTYTVLLLKILQQYVTVYIHKTCKKLINKWAKLMSLHQKLWVAGHIGFSYIKTSWGKTSYF